VRDDAARAAWREQGAQRDPEQLGCVAASGTHTALTRRYGGAPHDQRATGAVPRKHGHHTTVVAALRPDGLHEPWLIEGALPTERRSRGTSARNWRRGCGPGRWWCWTS
jgi:hypothetical protein